MVGRCRVFGSDGGGSRVVVAEGWSRLLVLL